MGRRAKGIGVPGLGSSQVAALLEAAKRLRALGAEKVVLFGSAVHGRLDEESDLDLLVVFPGAAGAADRGAVSDELFEINARHGTNLSAVVVDRSGLDSEAFHSLALHAEIADHGVLL